MEDMQKGWSVNNQSRAIGTNYRKHTKGIDSDIKNIE